MSFIQRPEWWIFALAVALLGLLIYWDVSARPARLRWARMAALALIVFALLALYLQPQVSISMGTKRVVLQTPNAPKKTLDSLQRLEYELVTDFNKLERNVDELVMVGDGLEAWELKKMNQSFAFIPAPLTSEGLLDFRLEAANERSPAGIHVKVFAVDKMELSLSGAGIEEVRKTVEPGIQSVEFTVVPQLAGAFTYQLTGARAQDTLFAEILPVHVKTATPPAVLILSGSPSFEWRYLKNHLSAAGFGVAERIHLSKDVYRESFTNLKEQSVQRLSEKVLEPFQLIVLDAAAHKALSVAERNALTAVLRKGEIGVVWLGETGQGSWVTGKRDEVRTLKFSGASGDLTVETKGWNTQGGSPIFLQNQEIGEVVSVGLGRVVVPSIASSYAWALRGEQALYADLWQQLLQPAMGRRWEKTSTPPMVWINEPALLEVTSDEQVEWLMDSSRLPLRERWEWPNEWTATVWPEKAGWQTITSSAGDSTLFFVFDSAAWPLRKARQLQAQTAEHALESAAPMRTEIQTLRPVSPWYFYGLFLLAIGFLWVEQRLG